MAINFKVAEESRRPEHETTRYEDVTKLKRPVINFDDSDKGYSDSSEEENQEV